MIPLTILYDEYIGRPKLTEQKNPVEYIIPPSPLKWGSEHLSETCSALMLQLEAKLTEAISVGQASSPFFNFMELGG